ncbi:MAG: GNAT family N-acetyltransferase [Parvularculaceae bacterium]
MEPRPIAPPSSAKETLRACSAADAPALSLIGQATFLDAFAGRLDGRDVVAHCRAVHDVASYETLLADGAAAWLVERADAPVGYAVAIQPPDLPVETSADDAQLLRIYLLPSARGRGHGARLMAVVRDWARERGAERLFVGVFRGDADAIGFYERSGFASVGESLFRVGAHSYADSVMMAATT